MCALLEFQWLTDLWDRDMLSFFNLIQFKIFVRAKNVLFQNHEWKTRQFSLKWHFSRAPSRKYWGKSEIPLLHAILKGKSWSLKRGKALVLSLSLSQNFPLSLNFVLRSLKTKIFSRKPILRSSINKWINRWKICGLNWIIDSIYAAIFRWYNFIQSLCIMCVVINQDCCCFCIHKDF